jgi:hypothetical protein
LGCIDAALEFGRKRFGFKIHMVPHWMTWRCKKYGVFCKPQLDLPEIKLDQIYDHIRAQTGIEHLATGAKDSDSMWRRRQLGTWGKKDHLVYPVQKWNKLQILGYLKSRGIPLPDSSNKQATGVDLSEPSIHWLREHYPDDYAKLLKEYPFAEAVVKRREFFGEMHEGYFDGETRPTKE